MSEIPKRRSGNEPTTWNQAIFADLAHEHAVAVEAVKALKDLAYMVTMTYTPDELRARAATALLDIEASGWQP